MSYLIGAGSHRSGIRRGGITACRILLLVGASAALLGLLVPEAPGQIPGVSQGMGWCPICKRDMPLSHDFTHGRNRSRSSGGGGNRSRTTRSTPRTTQPPTPPNTYAVVTLYNRTGRSITYSIRSFAGGGWATKTLAAGETWMHWYKQLGNFQISFKSGGKSKLYKLEADTLQGRKPQFSADGRAYCFEEVGSGFDLHTGPGSDDALARVLRDLQSRSSSTTQPPAREPSRDTAKEAYLARLKQLAESGEQAFGTQDYSTAYDRFREALELAGQGPGYKVITDKPYYQRRMADAMHALGQEALERGEFAEARDWFEKAIRKAVKASQLTKFRASLRLAEKRADERRRAIKEAHAKALDASKRRDWAAAVKYFEEESRLNPSDREAKSNAESAQASLQREAEEQRVRAKKQESQRVKAASPSPATVAGQGGRLVPFEWGQPKLTQEDGERLRADGQRQFEDAMNTQLPKLQLRGMPKFQPLWYYPADPQRQREAQEKVQRYLESHPKLKERFDKIQNDFVTKQKEVQELKDDPVKAAEIVKEFKESVEELRKDIEEQHPEIAEYVKPQAQIVEDDEK